MFGAIFGDIIGSYYENHCTKDYDFPLMRESSFTDDSVVGRRCAGRFIGTGIRSGELARRLELMKQK